MKKAAVVLALATATAVMTEVVSAGMECEADYQCDKGYCYLDTGVCTPCTDCKNYLRSSPKWRSCARGVQDCGGCIDGFVIDILADGSTRDFCVIKKQEENTHSERPSYLWPLTGFVVVISLIIFIFAGFCIYRGVKFRQSLISCPMPEDPHPPESNHDHSPPSYDSLPLLRRDDVSTPLVNSVTVLEKEGNALQQAVPFTNPHPPYGSGGSAEQEGSVFQDNLSHSEAYPLESSQESNDEEEGVRTISPPQLEDEDTMPSEWVPGNCELQGSHTEEQQDESLSSCTSSSASSLSDLTDPEMVVDRNSGQVLNDSGVSATCSHQSDLSCVEDRDLQGGSMRAILERRHSEEDIATLSELRANKRQRCDSGSASMQSMEPI